MDNYLVSPKLYCAGYLPKSAITTIRQKQGVQSQLLANNCSISNTQSCNKNMYPINLLTTEYSNSISDNCKCTYHLKSP